MFIAKTFPHRGHVFQIGDNTHGEDDETFSNDEILNELFLDGFGLTGVQTCRSVYSHKHTDSVAKRCWPRAYRQRVCMCVC